MAYLVTARKWRPRKFGEVVAQEHITTTLKNAILAERVAQCYLFCGPRGVGKTTTARILAKALNCPNRSGADPCDACATCRSIADGTSMNVLEIDGASNNSVDDVRELREVVRYVPTEGAYKIYIIDEVHMLSTAAFNALLKTLEEPPAHAVFIFATTEVQEVPETILSRCQRFNFRRIPASEIAGHLRQIAASEGIKVEDEALFLIANRADGALRDAESLLDQVVSFDPQAVSVQTVQQVLGLVDRNAYFALTEALAAGSPRQALDILTEVVDAGTDVEEFVHGLVEHMRHLLFARVQNSADRLEVAESERPRYLQAATQFGEEDLLRVLQALMELNTELRRSRQPRFRLEMTLVRLALMGRAVEVGTLLSRLKTLEGALQRGISGSGGAAAIRPPASPAPPAAAARNVSGAAHHSAVPERIPTEDESANDDSRSADLPPRRSAPAEGSRPAASSVEEDRAADSGDGDPNGGELDLDAVSRGWAELVQDVRNFQPALGIFLRGARLVGLDGKVLKLGFASQDRFPMSQVLKNRESVEKICARKWGQRLRLECVVSEGEEGRIQPEQPAAPEADPTVRSVLDAFDGELI